MSPDGVNANLIVQFTYTIPAAGQEAIDADNVTGVAAGEYNDGTQLFANPDTGGNTPGYPGTYVTAPAGGGTTNLGQNGYAPREGDMGGADANRGRDTSDQQTGADGELISAMEVYTIPAGTPQTDGTSRYIDPNTGGGSPGTAGEDQTAFVVGAGTAANAGAITSGYSRNAGYNTDGSTQGYAVEGDSTAGATYSIAYVIPPAGGDAASVTGQQTYDSNGRLVGFIDPNTGGGAPGYGSTDDGNYVTGAVGGGNNPVGRDDGLINTSDGASFNETGDFQNVGSVEEYAIPSEGYSDVNAGGNAPGYVGDNVTQGRGTGLRVAEGVGYSEIYTIPFTSSDTDLTGYQDPNTGGAAPGYQGSYVTGADDGSPDTTEGNEGLMALESYNIGNEWDGTNGGVLDLNQDPTTPVVGSSLGHSDNIGNPGYEAYLIPVTGFEVTEGRGYVDPNTGGNAPGYQGDYVTGVGLEGGGGVGPTGRTLANDLAAEAYTITSDTQIDPNTGGNMPGYQGDYVRPAAEYGERISTIVNLTEEFLGENTDSGKTTITEPSTTTKSSVVTSVATRCTANCGG
ncbi:MAG: hypothetical protein CMD69_00785 [Gammaproteobacteria bacterium]|nr:hypothetical protein [Gammaproteobacteria bacterium]